MTKVQKRLSILVVDDEPLVAKMMKRIATNAGHSAEQAIGGKEALEKYAAMKPDLVLSDYHMPGMTGLQLFRKLKETDEQVRMIILSGAISEKEKEACLAEGVKEVLPKPVDVPTLLAAINRFGF